MPDASSSSWIQRPGKGLCPRDLELWHGKEVGGKEDFTDNLEFSNCNNFREL